MPSTAGPERRIEIRQLLGQGDGWGGRGVIGANGEFGYLYNYEQFTATSS